MPRIRTIKPEFFTSETVASLPFRARLTFAGVLATYLDDHGRGRDNPMLVKAAVYPMDDLTAAEIEEDLSAIVDSGGLIRYEVDGKQYFYAPGWSEHQYINKPTPSRLPDPPGKSGEIRDESEETGEPPVGSRKLEVGFKNTSSSQPQLTLVPDASPASRTESDPPGFTEWWKSYPLKVGKRAAAKSYRAALRRGITEEQLRIGGERHANACRGKDPKYIPYPTTWLNQDRYADELPTAKTASGARPSYGC